MKFNEAMIDEATTKIGALEVLKTKKRKKNKELAVDSGFSGEDGVTYSYEQLAQGAKPIKNNGKNSYK